MTYRFPGLSATAPKSAATGGMESQVTKGAAGSAKNAKSTSPPPPPPPLPPGGVNVKVYSPELISAVEGNAKNRLQVRAPSVAGMSKLYRVEALGDSCPNELGPYAVLGFARSTGTIRCGNSHPSPMTSMGQVLGVGGGDGSGTGGVNEEEDDEEEVVSVLVDELLVVSVAGVVVGVVLVVVVSDDRKGVTLGGTLGVVEEDDGVVVVVVATVVVSVFVVVVSVGVSTVGLLVGEGPDGEEVASGGGDEDNDDSDDDDSDESDEDEDEVEAEDVSGEEGGGGGRGGGDCGTPSTQVGMQLSTTRTISEQLLPLGCV